MPALFIPNALSVGQLAIVIKTHLASLVIFAPGAFDPYMANISQAAKTAINISER